MNPKKLIQAITDPGRSRQERVYLLLVSLGLLGMFMALVVGFLAEEIIYNLLGMAAAIVILFVIVFFTIRYRRIQLGAVLVSSLIIFVVLPFNFITTGGIYGGAPIWMLFGVVFVCLVVEKRIKYFLIAGALFVFAACYCLAFRYPEYIVQHALEIAYIDSFLSLCIVTVLICGMILFQNIIFQSENEKTRKQKKEIEELNKAQNRFFSSMSHEIRTPINTIIGLNEMILRETDSDEVAADARNIQGAGKMLLALINDILDMSKIESGRMDLVPVDYNVGDMLSDIVNMIWIRAKEKGLEFHIDVDRTMPSRLIGDEVRIKQILINVLNNAVKYTSEGSVTLLIQCRKQENGAVQVSYSVTDTGIGIKKENIPYLFTAFKRVDEEKNRYIEGTGLGLSIVKQLVELMGGEISVNSVYTKGSTFVITLPQQSAGNAEIGELDLETRHELNIREHYKQSFEAPQAQILIVDDNETNLMVAEKLLRDTKVMIHTASSGEECLKKTFDIRYDVIFMDHLMPGMDGIECLHAIRTQVGGLNLNTPVVALTANAGSQEQALYRSEGFNGYLLKPVSGIQLETELLRHLPRQLVSMTSSFDKVGDIVTPVVDYRKKIPVMISTDSAADLPKNLIDKYQIAMMPYRVVTEGGEFLDGVETETDGVLSYIGAMHKNARSEPPAQEEYEEFFGEQLARAQYVIHIAMAKNVSKGYERAMEASKTFDNVLVVDSGHLSSGMGLMVLQAAEYAVQGMSAETIVNELERVKARIRTSFIVTDTEYLAYSGRISPAINKLCKVLMLHPIIVLKNSSMKVGSVMLGTRLSSWKKYIVSTFKGVHGIDERTLFITYAGLTEEELKEVEEAVMNKKKFDRIIYQKASPAISANCGPGTFGVIFMLK